MAPALTGALPPSALKSVQKIPVLLILTTLLFPPPSPCLALPSHFPPRQPPVVCGKISQYLVVCSPGHHQAQHPGLPLMFSPKPLMRIPDQMGVESGWSLASDEDPTSAQLPVIRNPLGKRGQGLVADEDDLRVGSMSVQRNPLLWTQLLGKRGKETGGGWLPMRKRSSRETAGGWMPMRKRDSRETGGGWMPLGKRSLTAVDDEGRGKRWRQTDGFWSPMGKRRRSDEGAEGEAEGLIEWMPGDGVWDRVSKRNKGKWSRVMKSWNGEPKEKWTRVMRSQEAGGKWSRVMRKRQAEAEKWSRVMRKRQAELAMR